MILQLSCTFIAVFCENFSNNPLKFSKIEMPGNGNSLTPVQSPIIFAALNKHYV